MHLLPKITCCYALFNWVYFQFSCKYGHAYLFWYVTEAVPVCVEVGEILEFTDGVRKLGEKVLCQDQLLQRFTAETTANCYMYVQEGYIFNIPNNTNDFFFEMVADWPQRCKV